jgi:HPr kinase/phosphorylase
VHASAVMFDGECRVFTGAPGCGKSVRVAQHILQGGTLVADDFLLIENSGIAPPATIAGVLAVRGYGLLRLPFVACCAPVRVVKCDGLPRVHLRPEEWQQLCHLGEVLPEDWMPIRAS